MTRMEQREFVQAAISEMLTKFRDAEIGPFAVISQLGVAYTKALIYFMGLDGARGALRHLADTAHLAAEDQPELLNAAAQSSMVRDTLDGKEDWLNS